MRNVRRWTEADDAQLKQLAASGLDPVEIAQRLNRTVGATEVRASALGVRMSSATAPATLNGLGLSSATPAPRLRKYFESLAYGKRTGRVAYVMDMIRMPSPMAGAEWTEDNEFNAANEILARPALKKVFAVTLREGCALVTEK
jgi:hypothetical protein